LGEGAPPNILPLEKGEDYLPPILPLPEGGGGLRWGRDLSFEIFNCFGFFLPFLI